MTLVIKDILILIYGPTRNLNRFLNFGKFKEEVPKRNIMVWLKLAKPAFVVGNFARGFFQGSVDELAETFTDAEITRFKDTADLLNRCRPWHNHLKGDAYDEINRALKQGSYDKARAAVSKHATEIADPSCITVLKMALVEVATKCTTLIKEALPGDIVVPKAPK